MSSILIKSTQKITHLKVVKEKVEISNIKVVEKKVIINSIMPNFSYLNHLGKEVIPQQLYIGSFQ